MGPPQMAREKQTASRITWALFHIFLLIPMCANAESAEGHAGATSGCPNCPSCEDRQISNEDMQAAVARALVGLEDPWGKDFGSAIARAEAELGCQFHREDPNVVQEREDLIAIAQDENTSPSRLQELSQHHDSKVKGVVARNPSTPVEVLRKLAQEGEDASMYGLAANPSTPPDILRELLRWRDPYGNTCLTNLADNPGAPADVLRVISQGEERSALVNLLRNPSTPLDILEELTRSSDTSLSFSAKQELQRRRSVLPSQ